MRPTAGAVASTRAGSRLCPGEVLPFRRLSTIDGGEVEVPDPDRLVHLQLRRFAGCPVCNLHLRSVVARLDDITAAGVKEVVVFHSTADDLRRYEADLPLPVVADPDRRLYLELGVESSRRALLDPRAWPGIVRAVAAAAARLARHRGPVPPLFPRGGRYGLPADLLIDPSGRVVAAHYGVHADDQWPVDELLAHARQASPPADT